MADRVIIAYGESGVGKSQAFIELFKWLRKQWAQKGQDFIARVYVGDGSKATYLDSGLVETGLIELVDYNSYPWPLDVTNQIAAGWFPKDGVEGAELVPPFDLKTRKPLQQNFDRVRLWGYEGLAVMGNYIMGGYVLGGLAEQAARGVKIGPDAATRVTSVEYEWDDSLGAVDTTRPIKGSGSGKNYGTNGTAHYMLGQTHLDGVIQRAKALPGWVYLTTHERAAQDKSGMRKEGGLSKDAVTIGAGGTIVGPEIIGGALTPTISKTVNETLHFVRATKVVKNTTIDTATNKPTQNVETSYRIYTRDHYDPDGDTPLRFKAVTRTPRPDLVKDFYTSADYVKNHPGTPERPGQGIVAFYEDLTKAKLASLAEVAELAAVAGGVPAAKEAA